MTARECGDESLIHGVNVLIEEEMLLEVLFIIANEKEIWKNQQSVATVASLVHPLEAIIF